MTGEKETLPFVLTGPAPARDTAAAWQHWCRTRKLFVPAPVMDRAAFALLSRRKKMLHNLHRTATHANLQLLDTPMSRAVEKLLSGRIEINALKIKPTTRAGVMVSGGGYQGKTECVCEIAAAFQERWLALNDYLNPDARPGSRDLHIPVAYVQTPVTAKPKSTCKAILNFFDAPLAPRMDLPELIRQVAVSLQVLILDDITRLRMHRADDQDTLDLIRAFMSMNVTLVLVGVDIPGSGLLREGRHDPATGQWRLPPSRHAKAHGLEATQTERRFDLIELDRFHYSTAPQITAWVQHLHGVQSGLRLLDAVPGMLTEGTMPEYLYHRTNGVVGLLERLIEDGCREAIDSGQERLDEELLEGIAIDLRDSDRRDVGAGEVPDVPDKPAPRKPRRGRNTVFDDRGPLGTAQEGAR